MVAAVVLLGGCAKRDFGGLCKLATEILTEPRITPSQRFDRFLSDGANHAYGSTTRRLLEILPMATPDQRYALMVRAAQEEGLEDWTCPALEAVLNAPVETSN